MIRFVTQTSKLQTVLAKVRLKKSLKNQKP